MKIFITGGCGFIGSNLAEYHLKKGDDVHVVDNLTTGSLQNIQDLKKFSNFSYCVNDILSWNELEKELIWCDRIYHLAAIVGIFRVIKTPIQVVNTSLLGTQRILDIMKVLNLKSTLVISSSSAVYGVNPNKLLNENDNLIVKPHNYPLSAYAISKLATESLALAYFHESNISIILPRLFNVIGPHQTGQYGMVVPRFIKQALLKEPLTIYGDGNQSRSFCDIRDCVTALDLVASNENTVGQIINIGNDHEISINDLAALVCEKAKVPLNKNYISYKEAYGMDFTDTTQRRPDLSKLVDLTGFKHKWTLETTIIDLINASTI